MAELSPVPMLWKDGHFIPATSYQLKRCSDHFEDGQRVLMVEHKERSTNTHNHYFAALHDAWQNLPEGIADEFISFDQFRATALIATGYYNERRVICATAEDAERLAAFIRPINPLAIISVHGNAIVERTAKSQRYRAMDKAEFRKSKEAVLAWAWGLCGVDPETGNANAGQAA